jgi:hypothetical protein
MRANGRVVLGKWLVQVATAHVHGNLPFALRTKEQDGHNYPR